jgi:hypothetical protein
VPSSRRVRFRIRGWVTNLEVHLEDIMNGSANAHDYALHRTLSASTMDDLSSAIEQAQEVVAIYDRREYEHYTVPCWAILVTEYDMFGSVLVPERVIYESDSPITYTEVLAAIEAAAIRSQLIDTHTRSSLKKFASIR